MLERGSIGTTRLQLSPALSADNIGILVDKSASRVLIVMNRFA